MSAYAGYWITRDGHVLFLEKRPCLLLRLWRIGVLGWCWVSYE